MQDFQFYVTDDRYTVPTLLFVQSRNVATARDLARRMMTDPHHRGVDVWTDDTLIFSLDEAVAA